MLVINIRGGSEQQGLPSSDVLEFHLEGEYRVTVRPSGTEPKIKAYLSARGSNGIEADAKLSALREGIGTLLSS